MKSYELASLLMDDARELKKIATRLKTITAIAKANLKHERFGDEKEAVEDMTKHISWAWQEIENAVTDLESAFGEVTYVHTEE